MPASSVSRTYIYNLSYYLHQFPFFISVITIFSTTVVHVYCFSCQKIVYFAGKYVTIIKRLKIFIVKLCSVSHSFGHICCVFQEGREFIACCENSTRQRTESYRRQISTNVNITCWESCRWWNSSTSSTCQYFIIIVIDIYSPEIQIHKNS